MKIVPLFAVLCFLVLSCEKKENSPPDTTPDPMEISDSTSAAPISSDTASVADSTAQSGSAISDTAKAAR